MSKSSISTSRIIVLGVYYGYPECCIKAFLRGQTAAVSSPLKELGYSPCAQCAQKDQDVLRTIITAQRYCKLPFPQDLDDLDSDHVEHKRFEDFFMESLAQAQILSLNTTIAHGQQLN
jgi:hypothetical protein